MIGTYLKEIRKNQNIKVVELAKTVKVSQPYISNIENEKRYPTKELFFKIIVSIAELSPINYDVYTALDLSDEEKKEIHIPDTLNEFWEKYSSCILEKLNNILDDDDEEIRTLEDFSNYVSSWSLEDMSIFPEYTEFLQSKYGFDSYGENLDYKDYSSYTDPKYVRRLVIDYWYQYFLTKFVADFEYGITKAENKEHILNTLTVQELEIFSAVEELRHKTGRFDRYQFKELSQTHITDLNIIDDIEALHKITLDGKELSNEDIISLQNVINGIRYKRY